MTQSTPRAWNSDLASALGPIRRIELAGGAFAYFEQGDPRGPLVVLQHGFPDFPKTFHALIPRLCAHGYRCVAPFLRGYAPSTTQGPFDQSRLGGDLAELVRALSPHAPAVLIGHDWGAIATYAAARNAPGLFRRAVTLAVPHVAALERTVRTNLSQQLRSAYIGLFMLPFVPERIVAMRDFAFVDTLWHRWSADYRPDPEYMSELKQCLRASMPGPLAHYRALRPFPTLPRIEVPLLHLHGSRDGCIGFEAGAGQERYFAAEFRSEQLEDLGHFLHLEAPERVAREILDFLAA
jgi:pimeloyl-ACP methyl ester carboxylesterase